MDDNLEHILALKDRSLSLSLSVTRAIFITTGWSHPLFLVIEAKAFLKHFHGPRETVTLKKLLIVGLCAWEGYKSHNEDLSSRATLQGTNISPQKWHFEDDFPFPKVGYVNPLEGIYHFPQIVRWVYIWIDLQQVQFSEIRTDCCCSSNKSSKMTTDVHVWECFFDAQEHLEHARYKAEKVREKEVLHRKHITPPQVDMENVDELCGMTWVARKTSARKHFQ